ncbi:MAG: cytochrome c oxidase assembly protein [Polyangiaceae bacterium]
MTTLGIFSGLWKIDPLAIALAIISTFLYARSQANRMTPRTALFATALLFGAIAMVSPVAGLADGYLFSAHMLQHLLLLLVVPPLALMSLNEARPTRARSASEFALRHPAIPWGLGVSAMWLWHEQTLCNAAAQNGLVHGLQEISLLVMGTAFWWPVLAPRAIDRLAPLATILYLFTACIACTMLGVIITFSPVEVCSIFAHPVDRFGVMPVLRNDWGLSAARDQQLGGLLMWVPSCAVYGVAILGAVRRLYREDRHELGSNGGALS